MRKLCDSNGAYLYVRIIIFSLRSRYGFSLDQLIGESDNFGSDPCAFLLDNVIVDGICKAYKNNTDNTESDAEKIHPCKSARVIFFLICYLRFFFQK